MYENTDYVTQQLQRYEKRSDLNLFFKVLFYEEHEINNDIVTYSVSRCDCMFIYIDVTKVSRIEYYGRNLHLYAADFELVDGGYVMKDETDFVLLKDSYVFDDKKYERIILNDPHIYQEQLQIKVYGDVNALRGIFVLKEI